MTKLNTTGMSTATLLALYNEHALELGEPQVKRFADREKAERRTVAMHDRVLAARAVAAHAGQLADTPEAIAHEEGVIKTQKELGIYDDGEDENLGHHGPKARDRIEAVAVPGKANHFELNAAGKAAVKEALEKEITKEPLHYNEEGRQRLQAAASETLAANPEGSHPASTANALSTRPKWARPKHEAPAAKAYKPKAGTVQADMYALLTQPGGIDINDFCAAMIKAGAKDKSWVAPAGVWSGLRYLFCSIRGYGLKFDGTHLTLLVPRVEVETQKGGEK